MDIKHLEGEELVHTIYGKGLIIEADKQYLEVEFKGYQKTCRFSYPSCFDGFVKLSNENLQADVKQALADWKVESGALEKEAIRKKSERTQKAIKQRVTAAEERRINAIRMAAERNRKYLEAKNSKKCEAN